MGSSILIRPKYESQSRTIQRLDYLTQKFALIPQVGIFDATPPPKFYVGQQVMFIGGSGTVQDCQVNSDTWLYVIEMELGEEPEMGRIGTEATILLSEFELQDGMGNSLV